MFPSQPRASRGDSLHFHMTSSHAVHEADASHKVWPHGRIRRAEFRGLSLRDGTVMVHQGQDWRRGVGLGLWYRLSISGPTPASFLSVCPWAGDPPFCASIFP